MFDYDTTNIYGDIEKYREIIKEQKDEISKREIIIDSLMDALCDRVKAIVLPYSGKMLSAACSQQSKTKKSEKEMYNFITTDLTERLFEKGEKVKFSNVTSYGYDDHAYGFCFTYENVCFELKIPNVKNANKENLSDMRYGRYVLFYKADSHLWSHITSSYDLDIIAKAIQIFMEDK